jgi:hypothetical protein
MPASSSSRDAYLEHVIGGRAYSQRERILASIRRRPGRTRNEIADEFKDPLDGLAPIPLGSVCGRVAVLLGAGLVREEGLRKNRGGAFAMLLWDVVPAPVQRTFEDFARLLDHEVSHGR